LANMCLLHLDQIQGEFIVQYHLTKVRHNGCVLGSVSKVGPESPLAYRQGMFSCLPLKASFCTSLTCNLEGGKSPRKFMPVKQKCSVKKVPITWNFSRVKTSLYKDVTQNYNRH